MEWKEVGEWVKRNAGPGAALVGSLLTGNAPGAIAAGVALVTGATGEADPDKVLTSLQQDPATLVRLRELAVQNDASIRDHIRYMAEIEAKDRQAEHEETGRTVRSGDNSADTVVRRARPLQAWLSLSSGLAYVGWREWHSKEVNIEVLMILLALCWAYAGLRQVGKGMDALASRRGATKA